MAEGKRTVFITGCSPGGIGNALAEEFLARGYYVLGTARNPDILKDLAAKGLTALALDVTNEESIKACSDEVIRCTDGKLDMLINNAGARDCCPLLDNTTTQTQYVYQTNVFGPMRLVQLLVPSLISTRGLIINISSASARIPYLFGGVYSSSKAALDNWTSVLRMELRPFHVRVMLSVTGTVMSANTKRDGELPANSLYKAVEDKYKWRLGYSQTKKTMPRETFAKRLVDAAEKGEGWLGGLIGGTPYDFWEGGMTPLIWTATTFLPKWLCEWVTWRHFGLFEMARRIQAARSKRIE